MKKIRISFHCGKRIDSPNYIAAIRLRRKFFQSIANQNVRSYTLPIDLRAAHAGEGEQFVDQLPHPAPRFRYYIHVTRGSRIQLFVLPLNKKIHKSVDVTKRSAQIVRDRVREQLQLSIRNLQLP